MLSARERGRPYLANAFILVIVKVVEITAH